MNTPRTASAASRPGLAALCPSGLARQAAYPGGLLRRERLAEPSFPLPSRRALAGGAARHRTGLADRLVHLDDLLHRRRELRVPRDLAAHLLHLARRELAADPRAPALPPGPQQPRPRPGVVR